MTPEQRITEIVRLENFRTGLQKQVNHYTELIKELQVENALVVSEYQIGDVVIASVEVDSEGKKRDRGYGSYEKYTQICKVKGIDSIVYNQKGKDGKEIEGKYEVRLYYILSPVLYPLIECSGITLDYIKGRYVA